MANVGSGQVQPQRFTYNNIIVGANKKKELKADNLTQLRSDLEGFEQKQPKEQKKIKAEIKALVKRALHGSAISDAKKGLCKLLCEGSLSVLSLAEGLGFVSPADSTSIKKRGGNDAGGHALLRSALDILSPFANQGHITNSALTGKVAPYEHPSDNGDPFDTGRVKHNPMAGVAFEFDDDTRSGSSTDSPFHSLAVMGSIGDAANSLSSSKPGAMAFFSDAGSEISVGVLVKTSSGNIEGTLLFESNKYKLDLPTHGEANRLCLSDVSLSDMNEMVSNHYAPVSIGVPDAPVAVVALPPKGAVSTVPQRARDVLDSLSTRFSSTAAEDNGEKNRYTDISPYDESRVKLAGTDGTDGTDYINASYVNVSKSERIIAAQGPTSKTANDFWLMIWQEKSSSIVMLTGGVEGGKPAQDTGDNSLADFTKRITAKGLPIDPAMASEQGVNITIGQENYKVDIRDGVVYRPNSDPRNLTRGEVVGYVNSSGEIMIGAKSKCDTYWPVGVGESLSHRGLSVTNRFVMPLYLRTGDPASGEIGRFSLHQVKKDGEVRFVSHFHFTAWPDHGVPDSPEAVASFDAQRAAIKHDLDSTGKDSTFISTQLKAEVLTATKIMGPAVTHCSAGVGRTGTHALLQTKLSVDTVDDRIYSLRGQRSHLVQDPKQYGFLLANAFKADLKAARVSEASSKDLLSKLFSYVSKDQSSSEEIFASLRALNLDSNKTDLLSKKLEKCLDYKFGFWTFRDMRGARVVELSESVSTKLQESQLDPIDKAIFEARVSSLDSQGTSFKEIVTVLTAVDRELGFALTGNQFTARPIDISGVKPESFLVYPGNYAVCRKGDQLSFEYMDSNSRLVSLPLGLYSSGSFFIKGQDGARIPLAMHVRDIEDGGLNLTLKNAPAPPVRNVPLPPLPPLESSVSLAPGVPPQPNRATKGPDMLRLQKERIGVAIQVFPSLQDLMGPKLDGQVKFQNVFDTELKSGKPGDYALYRADSNGPLKLYVFTNENREDGSGSPKRIFAIILPDGRIMFSKLGVDGGPPQDSFFKTPAEFFQVISTRKDCQGVRFNHLSPQDTAESAPAEVGTRPMLPGIQETYRHGKSSVGTHDSPVSGTAVVPSNPPLRDTSHLETVVPGGRFGTEVGGVPVAGPRRAAPPPPPEEPTESQTDNHPPEHFGFDTPPRVVSPAPGLGLATINPNLPLTSQEVFSALLDSAVGRDARIAMKTGEYFFEGSTSGKGFAKIVFKNPSRMCSLFGISQEGSTLSIRVGEKSYSTISSFIEGHLKAPSTPNNGLWRMATFSQYIPPDATHS